VTGRAIMSMFVGEHGVWDKARCWRGVARKRSACLSVFEGELLRFLSEPEVPPIIIPRPPQAYGCREEEGQANHDQRPRIVVQVCRLVHEFTIQGWG